MWAALALPVLPRWPSATAAAPPTGSGPRCGQSPWASPGTCSEDAAWSCAGCADRGRCSPVGSGCTAGLFPPGDCGTPVWRATLCWQHTPLSSGKINSKLLLQFGQITQLHNLKSGIIKKEVWKTGLCQCSLKTELGNDITRKVMEKMWERKGCGKGSGQHTF